MRGHLHRGSVSDGLMTYYDVVYIGPTRIQAIETCIGPAPRGFCLKGVRCDLNRFPAKEGGGSMIPI